MQNQIERLQQHENSNVEPGQPLTFSEAATAGDMIAQGDLYLMLVDSVPEGFAKSDTQHDIERQLVPGNTVGAKHCLTTLDGVSIYYPTGWHRSPEYDSATGPVVVCSKETTITHPTHGAVTVPAGRIVACGYQRVYDAEQRRERRAQD